MNKLSILALLGKKNNANIQVLSLANFLGKNGCVYSRQIIFNSLAKLPDIILRFLPIWLTVNKNDGFNEVEHCDIIVTCGRKSARYARYIKNTIFPNAKIVQILKPDYFSKGIDVVLVPEHDKTILKHKNLIKFKGFLCDKKTQDFYDSEVKKFEHIKEKFNTNKFIGVYVGGNAAHHKLSRHIIDEFTRRLNQVSSNMGLPLLIITSKKTSSDLIARMKERLKCDYYLHDSLSLGKKTQHPYYAFIGMATYNITTADSISAIAELLSTNKPLYIFTDGVRSKKYNHFVNDLILTSSAKELTRGTVSLENFDTKPLNNLQLLAREILLKLGI